MKESKAEFIQWMPFVLDALREHGGSATPREIYETVAQRAMVPDNIRFAKLNSGSLRFPNQVAWARQYLIWEGYLMSPKRGLWMLTPSGQTKHLSLTEATQILQKWSAIHASRKKGSKPKETISSANEELTTPSPTSLPDSYKDEILAYFQTISPAAFERFCADLLRHIGMEEVEVTGGSGDGGIDGEGYLRVGPLVTTKIAFQCKRYNNNNVVDPKAVREFRGSIGPRAEKGIFFTTSYFSDSARKAAREDLSKPIELVDGDRLVELLEQYEFGLCETKTYEVDYTFLANYESDSYKNKSS